MADVVLDNVVKCYGDTEVLHGLNLNIADHEFVVLVGPSGCGKSTTLRIIAGLEDVTAGRILIGGRVVNTVAPKHRNVAMVFQNYALYPHMNVYDNMSFGLKLRKTARKEIDTRVREAARMLDIEALLHRKPSQLSGGQRQRVAMGRAIVRTPAVFLFDEPLSNLDAQLRAQMRIDIKQLHQRMHATAVYVTHDQVEAMTLGDRIVVMRDGHVEQVGPPEELFWKPANTFVAGFIGNPPMNLLRAEIVYSPSENTLKLGPDVRLPLAVRPDFAMPRDNKVIVGIRSQDITPANGNESPLSAWRVAGAIEVIEPHGNETYLHIDLNGQKAMARCTHRHGYHVSDRVDFDIDPENLHLFDAATSERI